jgi:uncharacterized protein (TIGR04255 family)
MHVVVAFFRSARSFIISYHLRATSYRWCKMPVRSVPNRLKNEPLYEAVWEIRFAPRQAALELLTGQLHLELKKLGWEITGLSHLPASNVPPTLRQTDATFRYMPVVRLDGSPLSVAIGERVVVLSCLRPYTGWSRFGACIRQLAEILRTSDLMGQPERFSLKYLDVIQGTPDLGALAMTVRVGDRALSAEPLQLRAELQAGDLVHIVEVALPSTIRLQTGEELRGCAIGTDTLCVAEGEALEFWNRFAERLEHVHSSNKDLFFTLLSPATLQSLEPEYD